MVDMSSTYSIDHTHSVDELASQAEEQRAIDVLVEEMRSGGEKLRTFPTAVSPGLRWDQSLCNLLPITDYTEDPRLKNWDRWLEDRKRQQNALAKAVDRKPGSLAMNSMEDVRPIHEDKEMIELTNISFPPDKYRGPPSFWEVPLELSDQGNPNLPPCKAQLTKVAKGIIPDMEYVRVPDRIKQEKGVDKRSEPPMPPVDSWLSSEYLAKRRRDHAFKLNIIEGHRPDARELVVVGRSLTSGRTDVKERDTSPPTPCCVDEVIHETGDRQRPFSFDIIRDRITHKFDMALSWGPVGMLSRERHTCRLVFNTRVCVKRVEWVEFNNLGDVRLRYSWHRTQLGSDVLSAVPRQSAGAHFFFNKNAGAFLPGKTVTMQVCFHTRMPGVFTEQWELRTQPSLDFGKLHLQLWGISKAETVERQETDLENYLQRCMQQAAVNEALEKVMDRPRNDPPPPPVYRSFFLDDEIFRHTNPNYHYHPTVVAELSALYERVTIPASPPWSLSLRDLRATILAYSSGQEQEDLLREFAAKTRVLMAPCLASAFLSQKMMVSRVVLCRAVQDIETEALRLKVCYGLLPQPPPPTPPPSEATPRLSLDAHISDGSEKSEVRRRSSHTKHKGRRGSKSKAASTASERLQRDVRTPPSVVEEPAVNFEPDLRRIPEYRQALFIKVYYLLGAAVEQLAAAVQSCHALE